MKIVYKVTIFYLVCNFIYNAYSWYESIELMKRMGMSLSYILFGIGANVLIFEIPLFIIIAILIYGANKNE